MGTCCLWWDLPYGRGGVERDLALHGPLRCVGVGAGPVDRRGE